MREEILDGRLDFPGNALFEKYPEQEKLIKQFWKAIWFNYLNDNETNGLRWYEELGIKLYNDLVRRLSHHGWVTSNSLPGRKWASVELNTDKLLEFVGPDELQNVKAEYKYSKYLLGFDEATLSTSVRQNGEVKYTGLVREGFRDAGNTQFGYDMKMLAKYEDSVVKNLTKSMDKIRHLYPEMKSTSSSYDEVSAGIYEWHKDNELELFTTGDSVSDSRGRAISSSLSKVTNPISSKDFRSCLVITYQENVLKKLMKVLAVSIMATTVSGCASVATPNFYNGDYYMAGDDNCKRISVKAPYTIYCHTEDGTVTGYRRAMTQQQIDMYMHKKAMKKLN